jgi:hypothetical protein
MAPLIGSLNSIDAFITVIREVPCSTGMDDMFRTYDQTINT